jgi:hypothetical protein
MLEFRLFLKIQMFLTANKNKETQGRQLDSVAVVLFGQNRQMDRQTDW